MNMRIAKGLTLSLVLLGTYACNSGGSSRGGSATTTAPITSNASGARLTFLP